MKYQSLKSKLSENKSDVSVVFTFGRFQPPTSGHEVLVNKVLSEAKSRGYDGRIYTSQTTGTDRNPLKFSDKISFLKKSFPKATIMNDKNATSPFEVAKKLDKEGVKNVIMVVGEDRVSEFKRIGEYHNFESFEVVSAGHRDPDAEGVVGMSASKMRKAVSEDDYESFKSGVPSKLSAKDTLKLYDKLRKVLHEETLNENIIKNTTLKLIAKNKEVKQLLKKLYRDSHETIAISLLGIPEVENMLGVINDKIIKQLMKNVPVIMSFANIVSERQPKTITPLHETQTKSKLDISKYISEKKVLNEKKDIVVITLTKSEGNVLSDTVSKLESSCKKYSIPFYSILVDEAFVVDDDLNDDKIVIHNYNGKNKILNLVASKTCCFVRGGALVGISGQGLIQTLEKSGMFMISNMDAMLKCQNKFTTAISLQKANIPHPRTALITNDESIAVSLKRIGGKFPVILKTITGAEGIGVMIIDSMSSLKSVLQGLWKYNAEIIIQEHMKIDFDVRTLVLDGEIFASMKRIKGGNDFRTNKSLGNETESYILSKEEKELILRAAEDSGCYYCGVDHVIVDGELYIIEVNGSPGSGASKYMSYYGDTDKEISGKTLIDNIITHISDKENWSKTKSVVGVVEWVTIEGMKFKAKLDTGNGSYTSIHATDIKKLNDSRVSFKLGGKKFIKKIIDVKKIHFGGGEREERMAVELDMRLGDGKTSLSIFLLDNRSDNVYDILVGKKYLSKHGLVVDVAKKFTQSGKNETDK